MKKSLFSLLLFFGTILCVFALPGFTSYIPDNSGEYVFYKDNTFKRESYIGIVYYDETTLQLRYAAPKSKELSLPEKDISILVTINPDVDYIELTGERIVGQIMSTDEDTDIVNYLHDILYEFNSRRRKVDSLNSQEYKMSQDYPQFGGDVLIVFDSKIPLFNIKTIENNKGEKVLECATTGQLTSSQDKSFSQFYGFPDVSTISSTVQVPVNILQTKKAPAPKNHKYTYENQSITLDANWEQKMENFWTLGNDSLVTVSQIPVNSEDRILNEVYILRKLIESSENSYTNFLKTEFSYNERKCQHKIKTVIYQSQNQAYVQNTKILTSQQPKKGFISKNSTSFDFFSISTYEEAYKKTPSYFEKIVRSYKSN